MAINLKAKETLIQSRRNEGSVQIHPRYRTLQQALREQGYQGGCYQKRR